jgi:hypothetical protein
MQAESTAAASASSPRQPFAALSQASGGSTNSSAPALAAVAVRDEQRARSDVHVARERWDAKEVEPSTASSAKIPVRPAAEPMMS